MPAKWPPFLDFANSRLSLKKYPLSRENGYERGIRFGREGGGGVQTPIVVEGERTFEKCKAEFIQYAQETDRRENYGQYICSGKYYLVIKSTNSTRSILNNPRIFRIYIVEGATKKLIQINDVMRADTLGPPLLIANQHWVQHRDKLWYPQKTIACNSSCSHRAKHTRRC